jgi:CBS domain-containing protein
MLIKSIMTSEVRVCAPDSTVAAAARVMSNRDCGIVPVVDADGKLAGVVTDRDICLAVATKFRSPDELPVRDIMTTEVYTCSPDEDVRAALNVMKNHAVRCVPVVTADRRLAGVISIDDLVLRADSYKSAAISDEQVLDAFKAICARAVVA